MSIHEKKTEEMRIYERDTGKHAIWKGLVTEGYKKWQKGESVPEIVKERITTLVSPETKKSWQEYIEKHNISTISKLIRNSVEFYIEVEPKLSYLQDISSLAQDLKTPLTPIKGFAHIIIENYSEKLDTGILLKIEEIYSQSQQLENKINEILSVLEPEKSKKEYDILIIDNISTITVLKDFFELNGYKCKGVTTGTKGLEELKRTTPKLILLSIILPDIKGNDVFNKIKSYKFFKDVPIFYITIMSETEAKKITSKTNATGYFLKPFDLAKLKEVFNYL